jgi:hypothetical protein
MVVRVHTKTVQTSAKAKTKPPHTRGTAKKPAHTILTKTLGPERMAMVDSRLLNGETCEAIARTIKLDWKLLTGSTMNTIAKALGRYKKDCLVGKLVLMADPTAPRLSEFADKVDVLENLTKLVELQQTRVTKAIHAENTLHPGLLDRKTRYEVELLGNLYTKLADLQMDLGLLRKVPAKLQIEGLASRTQQRLQEAMNKSNRVDAALNRAFSIIEGKFTAEAGDDSNRKH